MIRNVVADVSQTSVVIPLVPEPKGKGREPVAGFQDDHGLEAIRDTRINCFPQQETLRTIDPKSGSFWRAGLDLCRRFQRRFSEALEKRPV